MTGDYTRLERDDTRNRFTFHPATEDDQSRCERLRYAGLSLAKLIDELCPDSSEKCNARDRVDEAVMWANASIARS